MDVSNSDADFDSYWEDEARNPNRNRIRIGRQYQATVPPLLKSGENDGRKLEELETLRWRPDNELSDDQLDQYLSVAKAVSLFARAIDNNCAQNIDSHIENNDTSEVPDSSTENNNEKTKTTNDTAQTQSVNDIKIQSALKGLSDFMTSHHPGHHDIGCRVPIVPQKCSHQRDSDAVNNLTILLSNDWTANESQLFSKALGVCGKNFGAIKKDFLPWKSVKSIIEYYYLKGVKENRDYTDNNDTDVPTRTDKERNEEQSLSANFLNRNCETISNSSDMDVTVTSASDFVHVITETEQSSDNIRITVENQKSTENIPNNEVKRFTEETKMLSISGQEVKPLKAKPILPSAIQESLNNVSTVGSLKFYLDGQLVLKLNAQQELSGQKCQWVESSDSAKRPRPLHKTNKILLIDRQDVELHNNSNNHKCVNSDDGSADSSDNDSMESNESAIIPSPSSFIAKKARVKIENSCNIPLASPTTTPISVKDQRSDLLNQCNKSVKIENLSAIKRENTSSITNFAVSNDDERKRKNSLFNSNEYLNDKKSYQSSLETKWYHTMIEKPQPPPKAHSSSTIGLQMHRSGHSRYDASLQALAPLPASHTSHTSHTSNTSHTSHPSHTSSTHTSSSSVSASSLSPSFLSNAIPVDLTRKSTSCSPLETKSSPSTSSTPNSTLYIEKDKSSKSIESPSPPPPRLQPPYVFPYSPYLPHSPTQCQNVKSSNNMCQKAEGRSLKLSPPDLPSIPATQPLPSQLAWLQNSLVSYLPIYEQYYRYYYGYGMRDREGERAREGDREREGGRERDEK